MTAHTSTCDWLLLVWQRRFGLCDQISQLRGHLLRPQSHFLFRSLFQYLFLDACSADWPHQLVHHHETFKLFAFMIFFIYAGFMLKHGIWRDVAKEGRLIVAIPEHARKLLTGEGQVDFLSVQLLHLVLQLLESLQNLLVVV